jgi:uncharacterized protein (TIGR03437 family)
LTNSVRARLGGIQAEVLYAGLSATGLYQVNVRVPETVSDGDVAVQVEIAGLSSPATAFVFIAR